MGYAVGQPMHHCTDHTFFLHFLVSARNSQVLINASVSRIPCLYIPGFPEAWFEERNSCPCRYSLPPGKQSFLLKAFQLLFLLNSSVERFKKDACFFSTLASFTG